MKVAGPKILKENEGEVVVAYVVAGEGDGSRGAIDGRGGSGETGRWFSVWRERERARGLCWERKKGERNK